MIIKTKEDLFSIVSEIEMVDKLAIEQARNELNRKMKPPKSLGVLEDLCEKVAGVYGYPLKKLEKKCHIVASADNGIIEEGVSSCPLEYTSLVSEAMLNKIAAIGIFTKKLGVELNVVDIGMATEIEKDYPNFYRKKVRKGTNNFYKEKAMSVDDVIEAIKTGIDIMNEKSFVFIKKLIIDINIKDFPYLKAILVQNKKDSGSDRLVSQNEIEKLIQLKPWINTLEVSLKNKENMDVLLNQIYSLVNEKKK